MAKKMSSKLFEVGDRYDSYEKVKHALEEYEQQTFSKFWKRDARLIASARTQRPMKAALKYSEIKYCCIYGGQEFRPSGKGVRDVRTFKKEQLCGAYISLRVSADGKALEVRSVSDQHNHERNKVEFQYLPHQRRLDSHHKENAKELLALQANKKLIKQKLEQVTGKCITLKDLSNIKQAMGKNSEDLDHCVNVLKNNYQAEIRILKDNQNNFKGMFIQTLNMKNTMRAFPEYLSMDGTYKLINIGVPVFLIIVEDGNCQTEIVAVCILTNEDKDSFNWFLKTFQENNSEWKNTKCIMTDKDLLERSVIKDRFPNVNLIICIFHSMRTFSREINCEKLGITKASRTLSLEILQMMVYAKTASEFENHYETLKRIAPKAVVDYFNKNWYPIKDEWSMSKNFCKGAFQNTTNNRIESINAKLKTVITKNSTLEQFIHSLFSILVTLESQRDYKAVYQLQKRLVTSVEQGSDEKKYLDYLTHESGKMVIRQLEYSEKVKISASDLGQHIFNIDSTEGKLDSGPNNCTCNFASGMSLPCRHIFAVRKKLRMPLFSKEIVSERWTLHYYKKNQRCLASRASDRTSNAQTGDQESMVSNESVTITSLNKTKCKNYAQKRKEALINTDSLANLVAISSGYLFEERMDNLKALELFWKRGERVRIVMINEQDEDLPYTEENMNSANETSNPECEVTGVLDTNMNIVINNEKSDHGTVISEVVHNVVDIEKLPIVFLDDNELIEETIGLDVEQNIYAGTEDNIDLTYNDTSSSKFQVSAALDAHINPTVNSQKTDHDIVISDINNSGAHNVLDIEKLPKAFPDDTELMEKTIDFHVEQNINGNTLCDSVLKQIQMPQKVKKRGRPKGSDLTTIGIPKRKTKNISFDKIPYQNKQKMMMAWFVDNAVIINALNGILIDEEFVETKPEKIPHSVLNEHVEMNLIRTFFSDDAWDVVENVIATKKIKNIWLCIACNGNIDDNTDSVGCSMCLLRRHIKCTTLKKVPKVKWFCSDCKK